MLLPDKYRQYAPGANGINQPHCRHFNACAERAFRKPTHMVRVHAGYYLACFAGELVEFDKLESGEWIAREVNGKWYGDPQPRLQDVYVDVAGSYS